MIPQSHSYIRYFQEAQHNPSIFQKLAFESIQEPKQEENINPYFVLLNPGTPQERVGVNKNFKVNIHSNWSNDKATKFNPSNLTPFLGQSNLTAHLSGIDLRKDFVDALGQVEHKEPKPIVGRQQQIVPEESPNLDLENPEEKDVELDKPPKAKKWTIENLVNLDEMVQRGKTYVNELGVLLDEAKTELKDEIPELSDLAKGIFPELNKNINVLDQVVGRAVGYVNKWVPGLLPAQKQNVRGRTYPTGFNPNLNTIPEGGQLQQNEDIRQQIRREIWGAQQEADKQAPIQSRLNFESSPPPPNIQDYGLGQQFPQFRQQRVQSPNILQNVNIARNIDRAQNTFSKEGLVGLGNLVIGEFNKQFGAPQQNIQQQNLNEQLPSYTPDRY